jgi:hypothetical protein
MLDRSPTASAARTRRAASGREIRTAEASTPDHAALAKRSGQAPPGGIVDDPVINQRQPVPHPLKAVQKPDQTGIIQPLQPAVLHQLHQMIKTHPQGVQGRIDRGHAPKFHDHNATRTCVRRQAKHLVSPASTPDLV